MVQVVILVHFPLGFSLRLQHCLPLHLVPLELVRFVPLRFLLRLQQRLASLHQVQLAHYFVFYLLLVTLLFLIVLPVILIDSLPVLIQMV